MAEAAQVEHVALLCEADSPGNAIIDTAEEQNIDVIVVGTRGVGAVKVFDLDQRGKCFMHVSEGDFGQCKHTSVESFSSRCLHRTITYNAVFVLCFLVYS